jgi:dihydrofolate synthase/folylpolyglutamate synthase
MNRTATVAGATDTRNSGGPESDAILRRLMLYHPKIIDLTLGRVERLLDRLDHPERRLPPVVHVAGTNGKGSVIAFLTAMVEAAGHKVHAYTSPHLVRFHERIRLAGELIPEAELSALLEECEMANGEAAITFFEITTAAAFLAFARQPADVLLLETGLGGRLDATNVLESAALSAITPVGIDHTQYLGPTVAEIAGEKAGILKAQVPAVVGRQPAAAAAVIEARADALGTPLSRHGAEWTAAPTAGGMCYREGAMRLDLPAPALGGPHQIDNAGIAIACARRLTGFDLDHDAIARGLTGVVWPARLQRLARGPLPASLPPGWELWLDGGHNAGAGAALARAAAAWSDAPVHLVIGMLGSKEPETFAAPLAPHAASLTCVPVPDEPAGLVPDVLCARLARLGPAPEPMGSVAEALDRLAQSASSGRRARVLICGSLYLLGSVLAENEAPPVTA